MASIPTPEDFFSPNSLTLLLLDIAIYHVSGTRARNAFKAFIISVASQSCRHLIRARMRPFAMASAQCKAGALRW